MEKVNTREQDPSRVTWDQLEAWARGKVQELIQTLLEEEITELLGPAEPVAAPGASG
jgi:hypothetical protein